MKKQTAYILILVIMIIFASSGCNNATDKNNIDESSSVKEEITSTVNVNSGMIPKYKNTIWEYVNENARLNISKQDGYTITKDDLYAEGQIIKDWDRELPGSYCVLPDEIANELSNEELLDILSNQYWGSRLLLSDFWSYYFECMVAFSNIFDILIARDNVEDTFYEAYINLDISKAEPIIYSTAPCYSLFYEMVLSEDVIYEKLTDDQKKHVEEVAIDWEEWRRKEEYVLPSWFAGSIGEPEYYSIFLLNREGKLRRTYNWKYEE